MKAELRVHNGRSVLIAAAQSVCPALLRPCLSAHSPPSTHPTPAPPRGQLKGRPYERTCSPPSQKFPPGLCQPQEELAQRDPGLPPARPSGALPTLMSRGFRPPWSAGFSFTRSHQVGLSEKEVKSQRVRLKVRGPEIQISGGARKSEAARLPTSVPPPQVQGRKECPVETPGANGCVPAQLCHWLAV